MAIRRYLVWDSEPRWVLRSSWQELRCHGRSLVSLFIPTIPEHHEITRPTASTVGTLTQFRVFGGVVGVVVCRVVQSSYLKHHLPANATSSSNHVLSPAAREVYGAAFNCQARVLTCIAAANVVVACFTLRRRATPIGASDPSTDLVAEENENTGVSTELDTIGRQREGTAAWSSTSWYRGLVLCW
jgi:hypothetical protein